MNTKFWAETDRQSIKEAALLLRQGQLVAFPTETVYGLGANALDEEAAKKIYQAKGRPSDNPLIVHIYDMKQLEGLTTQVSETARKLMEYFWPGPLTVVLPKGIQVPMATTGGLETVAIRMPNHPIALQLLEEVDVPIAAPSANTSGKPSPTTAQHVWHDLAGKIAGLLEGGATEVGLESTVLDVSGEIPVILRPGSITKEQIEQCLECSIHTDTALQGDQNIPKAPGMKYTHYAPAAPLIICDGHRELIVHKLQKAMKQYATEPFGLMVSTETLNGLGSLPENVLVKELGSCSDLNQIGANLFASLRWFDQQKVNVIYTESFPEESIGSALMNRLYKAAGGQVI